MRVLNLFILLLNVLTYNKCYFLNILLLSNDIETNPGQLIEHARHAMRQYT